MSIKITKRSEFPECVRNFKELKGICIGKECVDPNDHFDGELAHAHSQWCWTRGKYQGWICIAKKRYLSNKLILLHEVAHLIACKSPNTPAHGKKWKQALVSIGGSFKPFDIGYGYKFLDYTHIWR